MDVPEGAERSDGSSQTNPAEAQKIVNVVKKLVGGHDVLPCDIGIVTPYAAQVRAIKRLLHGHQPNRRTRFDTPPAPDSMEALEVSTVDGFQGRKRGDRVHVHARERERHIEAAVLALRTRAG